MTKRQQNAADKRINALYCKLCSGVQIDIMDIGKVFKAGYAAIANGADDAELGAAIVAFVQTIRKN
jgi:hypothetical protein